MPYVLEVKIKLGPSQYKLSRSRVTFHTKREAEAERAGAGRFFGPTRVVRVGENFDYKRWNADWLKHHASAWR
jgi:hypothetical protein